VAYPRKNRYGGFTPHIVYEKLAKEYHPELFPKDEEE